MLLNKGIIWLNFYSNVDYPQNPNNYRHELQFDSIRKWSNKSETSNSSSEDDSPPPLSRLFNANSASLSPCLSSEHVSDCLSDTIPSEANKKKKNEEVAPYLSVQVSVTSVLCHSSRLTTQPDRYCTSAGLELKSTMKEKAFFTKLRSIETFW